MPQCLSTNVVEERGVKSTNCTTAQGMLTLRRVAGNTVDEFQYDDEGRPTGVTVRFGEKAFAVSATKDKVRVPGLPTVSRTYDGAGRIVSLMADGKAIVSYRRNGAGKLSGVTIGNDFDLSIENDGDQNEEVLRRGDGSVVHRATVPAEYARRTAQRARLNLINPVDLQTQRIQHNATQSMDVVVGSDGSARYFIVVFGADRVVFDTTGRALLLDLDLMAAVDEGPASAVVFSRVLIAANGDVEAVAPLAPAGSALACGVRTDAERGRTTFTEVLVTASRTSGIASSTYLCDVSSVCTTWPGGSDCSTTYYYCEGGSDGGCFGCTGGESGPSGGATGSSAHPNNHIANSFLNSKVNAAMDGALTKLQAANCQNVFSQFQAANGQTLTQILAAMGSDPQEYLSLYMQIYDGTHESTCVNNSSTVAFTAPGSRVVYVCPPFANLPPSTAQNRLIHEELHSVGLGENPPSDGEIDNAVQAGCGS